MPTVELRFGALPGHVRTARLVAAALSRRVGVPDELLDEIKLAVGEACARAVAVNLACAPEADVVVRFTGSDEEFAASVADEGPAGGEIPTVVLPDEAVESGAESPMPPNPSLGLALIESLADATEIAPRPDRAGSVVTMRWRLAAPLVEAALGVFGESLAQTAPDGV